jgi:hypothetical protein
MRKWWQNWKDRILDDELYFRRQVRSLILTVASGAGWFSDKLAELFAGHPHPKLTLCLKIAGLVALLIAFRMRMGDRNPTEKLDDAGKNIADAMKDGNGNVELPLPTNSAILSGLADPKP